MKKLTHIFAVIGFLSVLGFCVLAVAESLEVDTASALKKQIGELTDRVKKLEAKVFGEKKKSYGPVKKLSLKEVSNPNPSNHKEFTKLLSHPGLVWADSLRPSGNKTQQDQYYGRRRLGGSGKLHKNNRVEYDAKEEAAKINFIEGEQGMPHTYQTRIKFPPLSPANAKSATVRWEYKIPQSGWSGGKQFQIATDKGDLHVEFQLWGSNQNHGQIPGSDWIRLPALRVYRTVRVGGRGLEDLLVGGSGTKGDPDYCPGIFVCTLQPNLPDSGSVKVKRTIDDHRAGRLFAMRPNVWATIEITFDWRDPENHKLWMHLTSPDTPRTLVLGTNGDGYLLEFQKHKTPIGEWWIEFNNSKGVNSRSNHVFVRNFVVLKDTL